MAIATSTNYYANAIVGQPMAGADINVHERNTTPKFAVGFGFQRSDGAVFRYVNYGGAVIAGSLVGAQNTNQNLVGTNALVVAPATAQAVAGETVKPGAVNSRYVEVILATVANNQFAGGYLVTAKDTGAGYTYRIRGNTATDTPTSGNFRIELYEPLKVALDNTTDLALAQNKYADLGIYALSAGSNTNVVGVCMAPATAGNYGWIGTKGIFGVLSTGTAGFYGGEMVAALMSGACDASNTLANLVPTKIGTCIVPAGAAGGMAIVNLKLE